MSTKVTIGIPSGPHVHAEFMECVAGMAYRIGLHGAALNIANIRSSLVAVNRNEIVKAAREQGSEFVLMADADMTFPPDALHRLLAHGKDVVGVTYRKRLPPHDLICQPLGPQQTFTGGCIEVEGLGAGLLLIRTAVFDGLARPYFQHPVVVEGEPSLMGEDCHFCKEVRKAGFGIWLDVDLSRQVGHITQHVLTI